MNREIKFRGKSIDTGEWLEDGCLLISDCKKKVFYQIYQVGIPPYLEEIIPESVGQFTGMYDKNGKEIYEGDVVKWGMHKGSEENYHRYAVVEINPDIQFRILFYVDGKTGEKRPTDNYVFRYGQFAYNETNKHLEIIGNIHENENLK